MAAYVPVEQGEDVIISRANGSGDVSSPMPVSMAKCAWGFYNQPTNITLTLRGRRAG
jgi:hypothetical protein